MPPWDELVVYELHVGTFNDDRRTVHPGGLRQRRGKLDHLHDLGVTAIELLPCAEFATDFSWGYNPAHIFAVESAYGGPDALKRLVRAAHARGIAVIADVVFNHLGPERPGPVAVRRLERERQGRHLLLQRRAQPDAVGRHAARLRPRRGRGIPPRQREAVAGGVPLRRAPLGHDRLHPQPSTAATTPATTSRTAGG